MPKQQKAKTANVEQGKIPPPDRMPADMPLTNRLDKMTSKQARWAIRNGDAWLEYLKSVKGSEIV